MNKSEIEKYANKECYVGFKGYLTGNQLSVKCIIESVNKGLMKYIVEGSYRLMPAKRIISIEEVD